MTFEGTGMDDLQRVLANFPKTFTAEMIVDQFEWSARRARQAIVNGQQADVVMATKEVRGESGATSYIVYENRQWRKQWVTRCWGVSHEWRELAG